HSLDLDDILATRRVVECELARLAAARVAKGEADMTRASALLEQMSDAVADMERFVELDVQFHAVIADAAGPVLLRLMLASLGTVLLPARQSTFAERERRGEGHEATLAAHRSILRAIQGGEVESAGRAMENHLKETRRDVGPRD